MKYLITGHQGFLGKNLVEKLKEEKSNQFYFLGRLDNPLMFEYDIKQFSPDYIINLGGEIYDERQMMYSNVSLVQQLLFILNDVPYKHFVHIGSSSEYGYKKNPMSESDILEPRTIYEATKGMATLYCQAFSNEYNKPITVVRPFSVYGRYDREHKLIPTLIKSFINKTPVKISHAMHDFIYVDDFIEGLLTVLYMNNSGFDIVNIGTGVSLSNLNVYMELCDIFGYQVELEILKDKLRTFDSMTWEANIDKLRYEYGFYPKTTLKQGLIKTINEYNK